MAKLKKIFQFSLLLLLFLFLFSFVNCKKNNTPEIHITGKVYDPNTKEYVSGVNVFLAGNGIVAGTYSPAFQDISNTTTDVSGSFSFTINKDKIDTYRLIFLKPKYFEEKIEFSSSYFDTKDTYFKSVNFFPVGYVKLRIVNAYPFDDDDKMIYYFNNSELTCYDCCDNTVKEVNGTAIDTIFTCLYHGNAILTLFRNVVKNNISSIFIDTLYCNAFDTTVYYISY